MPDWIKAYEEAFSTPFNVFLLLMMFIMLLFWWSAHLWQTPERVQQRAKFFSPKPTQILQKLRTNHLTLGKYLDFICIHIWLWVFAVTIVLEVYICGLQGKEAWRYGVMTLLAWGISMLIQFLYPVIVPNRWDQFGRDLPIVPIRLIKFPQSDNVNGLLYNGLPSNHFGMMLAGILLSLFFYADDRFYGPGFSGWLILAGFFLLLGISFIFATIYLGEHYLIDFVASFLVYVPIMVGTKLILDVLVPLSPPSIFNSIW
ncbi:MAG: phosphatase PAP2 family protein [Candidatus Thorarchaeota archaeon]